MFGGQNALYCPRERLYVSPADNLQRFEFSDADAKLAGFLLHSRQRNIGQRRSGQLRQILEHEQLYKHYPELQMVPFELYWTSRPPEAQVQNGHLLLHAGVTDTGATIRRHICHEAQHLIQMIEGFSGGGDPDAIFNRLIGYHRRINGKKVESSELRRVFRKQAHQSYRDMPGEKEARDTEARMDWPMKLRLANPPVNAKLAEDETGVTFKPREIPGPRERLALAQLNRNRRQLIKGLSAHTP